MDREDLKSIISQNGLDLWSLIETAISIASTEHRSELKSRRDGIVERLYAPVAILDPIKINNNTNNNNNNNNIGKAGNNGREEEKGSSSPFEKVFGSSPLTPQSNCRIEEENVDEEEVDIDGDLIDDLIDQERKILAIKDCLEDTDQPDEDVASLLQSLADMDITFKALRDTDIGRHVNGLRKHQSTEVRRLVKQLVRKWKEIVDEWVKNNPENASPANNNDADSPQQMPAKNNQNGHHVPEFAYSPDLHNGRMSSNRNSFEPSAKLMSKREAPAKPVHTTPSSAPQLKMKEQNDASLDGQRLANARKRLAENYQEAQNAKKQRTIQVMDIHEIPKPKNSFIARNNKGGHHNSHQAKRW